MARFLVRLANRKGYSPSDVHRVSEQIRTTLGSKDSASHFRIGTKALEFNLFVRDKDDLLEKKRLLENEQLEILGERLLDTPPVPIKKTDALKEGIELFNEERFWESHEVLETIWRASKGAERDAIQALILAAAAFVHYQKNELDVCLSVLKRARAKTSLVPYADLYYLRELRANVDSILNSGQIRLFKLS